MNIYAKNRVESVNNRTGRVTVIEDRTLLFEQLIPSSEWHIPHNMGKYPSVTVMDSAGNKVGTEVQYIDENNLIVKTYGAFSGRATLN